MLQPLSWTLVHDFFLTGNGSESGTFTSILLWDLLQKAEVIVEPDRRNELSRKSVLIATSGCIRTVVCPAELDPRLGSSHQVIVAFMRDNLLLGEGERMARIINTGDKTGARRVFHITCIRVLTLTLE